jgi:hypothetical protein
LRGDAWSWLFDIFVLNLMDFRMEAPGGFMVFGISGDAWYILDAVLWCFLFMMETPSIFKFSSISKYNKFSN